MSKIIVEHHPSEDRLNAIGILSCPTWSKEPSTFPWTYSQREIAFILEGDVIVTPEGGEPVHFSAGDLVTFETGLKCTWTVIKHLRKHYLFE
jgi:uncharacterized cupin superfamily protein